MLAWRLIRCNFLRKSEFSYDVNIDSIGSRNYGIKTDSGESAEIHFICTNYYYNFTLPFYFTLALENKSYNFEIKLNFCTYMIGNKISFTTICRYFVKMEDTREE